VQAVLGQTYAGDVSVIVVLDQAEPDATSLLPSSPRVQVISNYRVAGLSGARNSGILSASTDLIAFCDDDDEWKPTKLQEQVAALQREPSAPFASCAIDVDFDGRKTARLAGSDHVTHEQLLVSRMSMLHSSTFLIRREALLAELGLVDEQVPGSQNEDWDLLLRASALHPIVHVDKPLVTIMWTARSYFSREWDTKISSLEWMLERHPGISTSRDGAARVYGQIAFAHAASGARGPAVSWARRAISSSWREPRGYLALATAAGVSSDFVLRTLHRRGRGV
jgi:glycosyltransferase involved in cell wall biosynthesis